VHAHTIIANTPINKFDSLLPWQSFSSVHTGIFLEVLDAENSLRQSGNMKKTMLKLLRIAGMKKEIPNNTLKSRILLDLANISTRLRMYPLAIKCYGQALKIKKNKESTVYKVNQIITDTINYFHIITPDTSEIIRYPTAPVLESLPVLSGDITCSFRDGKKASSYAIIVHVKQPIPGKRKAFCHINNVGHTFITLIKLNEDNSSVSRSFGFYPAKKSFLSATPIHPNDISVIKDDALHPWDETVAKFISEKKFNRILSNLEKFSHERYNLNRNNCTDFGLSEALIAGINIKETSGRWPLGKGNNPANAGQSLLEKKFENQDTEYPETFSINESQILFDESN
jgi:hypothetical protein